MKDERARREKTKVDFKNETRSCVVYSSVASNEGVASDGNSKAYGRAGVISPPALVEELAAVVLVLAMSATAGVGA